MADHLSVDATDDFLNLTTTSHFLGIIGSTIFLERLLVLIQIGHPNEPATAYAQSVVSKNEWPIHDDDWSNDKREETAAAAKESVPFVSSINVDKDGCIYFTTNAGGLTNWVFHPLDPDFFPSIPHGHWENRNSPKLDSYLGWVYNGSRQIKRIARKDIIALWNDDKFRDIAMKSIDYYLTTHPHYNGWRVGNPRKLPGRRSI